MRVPTPNVSVVDLAALVEKSTTKEAVNAAFKEAADGSLKGILQFMEEPLVSVDFRGNDHSSILDAQYTLVMDGDFVKLLACATTSGDIRPLRGYAEVHREEGPVVA